MKGTLMRIRYECARYLEKLFTNIYVKNMLNVNNVKYRYVKNEPTF